MPFTVLCIGDIVGKPGRQAAIEVLPKVAAEHNIDFIVANAENSAGGSGLTPAIFTRLLAAGVDVCTLGDHTYRKKEVLPLLQNSDRLVRPANYPAASIGRGWTVVKSRGGISVAVLQVMGRLYMNPLDDPFQAVDRMLAEIPADVTVRILDFHAEASSEKIAMGWHVDGRVSINYGTHTHTPTADARVLPGGTAFVSDLGMTGAYDSVLGRRKDRVLKHLLTGMPQFFEVATGDPRVCGILTRIDVGSGKALTVQRLDTRATEQAGAYDADDRGGAGGGEV